MNMLLPIITVALATLAGVSSAQDVSPSTRSSDPTGFIVVFSTEIFKVVVDGEEIGVFRKNETRKLPVVKGQHLILALDEDGKIVWRRVVDVEPNSQIVVEIEAPKPKRESGKSTLIVRTDTPCSIEVNGRRVGRVKPGEVRTVYVPSGDNILIAKSVRWAWWKQEHTFYVREGLQKSIDIDLGEERLFNHDDRAEVISDTHTGLTWSRAEIAEFQDWSVAVEACERLTLGGHTDWQMPDLKQLKTLMGDETKYFFRWYESTCPVHWTSTVSNGEEVYCVDVETKRIHTISTSATRVPGRETAWDNLVGRDPSAESVCTRPICIRVSPESVSR